MRSIKFYYRYKDPIFFSIERVFGAISGEIRRRYAEEYSVGEEKMPYVSKPSTLFRNISFTRRRQADINHITGDVHYAILGCRRRNVKVLTIHDCVPLHTYPKTGLRYWVIKWLYYSWPVRWADQVTVISEKTRDELVHFTGLDPARIMVISNFVDPAFKSAPASFNEACPPRLLFIGTTPNKNLDRVIQAIKDIPCLLDIVGELSTDQKESLRDAGVRYEQSARLSQEELLAKYQGCDMLVFPSTYEGFGLPVVEAQAVGRPVLTSQISPLREVAGEGGCLVDPYDSGSIRQGILRIIRDPAYREELVKCGWKNAARYSLAGVTEEYIKLYRKLVQQKGLL